MRCIVLLESVRTLLFRWSQVCSSQLLIHVHLLKNKIVLVRKNHWKIFRKWRKKYWNSVFAFLTFDLIFFKFCFDQSQMPEKWEFWLIFLSSQRKKVETISIFLEKEEILAWENENCTVCTCGKGYFFQIFRISQKFF